MVKLLLLFVFLTVTGSELNFDATMKKVACIVNPEYFVNLTCKLKPIKRYVSLFNLKATLIKPMETAWV